MGKSNSQYKGPFNTVVNEARVFTPKDTSIVTPNSDTPYSIAQLDLRAEPIVLCVPTVGWPGAMPTAANFARSAFSSGTWGQNCRRRCKYAGKAALKASSVNFGNSMAGAAGGAAIQAEDPLAADKKSNWLPAPDGPIYLVMGLYWPKETAPSILPPGDGTWKPPAVQVSQ